jgi:hypothetical protein
LYFEGACLEYPRISRIFPLIHGYSGESFYRGNYITDVLKIRYASLNADRIPGSRVSTCALGKTSANWYQPSRLLEEDVGTIISP